MNSRSVVQALQWNQTCSKSPQEAQTSTFMSRVLFISRWTLIDIHVTLCTLQHAPRWIVLFPKSPPATVNAVGETIPRICERQGLVLRPTAQTPGCARAKAAGAAVGASCRTFGKVSATHEPAP